ncbi:hypothetical protein Tco_1293786 [Tanacetum coccineum]
MAEARKKRRKRSELPRTPSGSPPPPPPPPPSPIDLGALGAPGALGSSQMPPPPPPPSSTDTSRGNQQQGGGAPSSSKTATLTQQSMAWTTSDTRYETTSFTATQETSPTDYLLNDDSIPDEQVHLSNDEDIRNDHLPKADLRKDWWKPLPEEERPATPEPAWTISSSNVSDVENNWAYALVSTYEPPAKNLLLAKTGDMTTFMNCSRWMSVTRCLQIRLTRRIRKIDEVCTYDISAAYGISHWWFNRLKFYIERHDSPSHRREVRKHMQILSVVRIKAYSRYGYDYLSEIVLRRANLQEHKIVEKDFKNLYPSDFEDLNFLLLQGHLDHLLGSNKCMLSTAVKLWTRNLVIRQWVEDFQLGIESYQTQMNLTKPGWDAKVFEFKHDYTIIESSRVLVFPINNNE